MIDQAPNPLLHLGFDLPFDRIRPEHVQPAVRELLAEAEAAIAAIATRGAAPTYESTLEALEKTTERLELAMTVVGHLESVASTPALREAYNAVLPEVSAFYARIPLNDGLWNALRSLAETDEAGALDPARKRFLDKTLADFRRHGAELDPAGKARLEALSRELAEVTSRFSQNVVDASGAFELMVDDRARLAGLPDSAVAAAEEAARAKGAKGFRFTLHAPSYVPAMTYLEDGELRERIWRAFDSRATSGDFDNRPLVGKILELRREKARLLGYQDFADLVLEDRMAQSGANARAFVRDLRERTEPFYVNENDALLGFRREEDGQGAKAIQPWELAYWAEKQRRARYDFDEEELRPYFPLPSVIEGLFAVVNRLYGIRVEERRDVPVWHPDVRSYSILDADGSLLCAFYADLHPRDEKRGGAWMNGLVTGLHRAGAKAPHLGLICANFTPPSAGKPALLTHREVETLFHEFGHLLHHALSRPEIRSLGGTNVAWDFVELPSQIMENWCWERDALDLFARHHETGARIPEALFEKMIRARTYRAANAMMRQLGFAEVDLAMHTDFEPKAGRDVMAFARGILQAHTPAPLPESSAMIASFGHLFASGVGYAAGYYSYKWAEVLDADAFSRFREEGLFNPDVGRAFREEILARGDSAEPAMLFRSFRGREPSLDALLARSGLLPVAG
ncbi:M3 family metallopeptidase [Vulgatibacter incomptus]|uniref:oligopeptidase A n=1 Tax=Vulgatibacter incomptus TaxID=1391653 RepID=A0A0K1PHQ3_9BACT|nr:M3 family metallopeptidase [Vulgatibacter incomptus]AKU92931.1 Oligopeptidase A [Vulgatibacter incomptus]